MNRTIILYIGGFVAVAIAIAFPSLTWLSSLTFVVIFPLAAIWIWKSEGRSLWDLGCRLSGGWLRYLIAGVLFGLVIPVLFKVTLVLGKWVTLSPRADPTNGLLAYLPALLVKMIFLVAIEEFVFRGFFLQAFGRKTSVWVAVLLSSLLWGAGHLTSMVNDGLTPVQMLIGMTTFLLWGIVLCLCYLKAGKSLWLPYGLHLGINLSFSLVGWPFITQPNAPQWWIGHPDWSPESGLIGIVVWLVLAAVIYYLPGKDPINMFSPS